MLKNLGSRDVRLVSNFESPRLLEPEGIWWSNEGVGKRWHVPILHLVFTEDTNELATESALWCARCAFHEQHDRSGSRQTIVSK